MAMGLSGSMIFISSRAPFDAIAFCLEGEARVIVSGKPVPFKEGEMVIMPAHKPHALKALEKFKMLLIMIRA